MNYQQILTIPRISESSLTRPTLISIVILLVSLLLSSKVVFAAWVDPATCGGDGQPACYLSSAKNLGKVIRPNPGSGAFNDPRNGGEYWRCPAGYSRTVFAVTADNACEKTNPNPGNGAFIDPRNGGEYWRCPAGYSRTVFAVTAGNACEKRNSNPGGGAFWDPRSDGQWWRCPAGFNRTLSAVTASDACSKKISKPTGSSFFDPRHGGEWWDCGSWGRSIEFPVDHSKACYQGYFNWGYRVRYRSAAYKGKTLDRRRATHVANSIDHNGATKLSSWKNWVKADYISAVRNPKPAGAFEDPRLDDLSKGAEYWSCPSGFYRNLNPISHTAACSANIGQACDSGNIDVGNPVKGYTCFKKNECGKNGQRPCLIVERIPSCDSGLAEDFVDGICVDQNLAMCLTASRGLWLVNSGVKAANNTQAMKTFKKIEKGMMGLITQGIEEIKKTLPKPIRDQFERDFTKEIVALLPVDFEGAQEMLLTEIGVDTVQMNRAFNAANTKSGDILNLLANPKVCYNTEQQLTTKVNEILGFTPSVALLRESEPEPGWMMLTDLLVPPAHATGHTTAPKSWMMLGISGGLNLVHPQTKASAGVALDLYIAVGLEGQGVRLFFAMGPTVAVGEDAFDIGGSFGFKATDQWSSFEGWAGSLGLSVEGVKSKGIRNRMSAAGIDVTFLDPFAKLDQGKGNFHLDGFVIPLGDLSQSSTPSAAINVTMQHTWRINPKALPPSNNQASKMCYEYPVEGDRVAKPCDSNKSTWDQNTNDFDNTMD